jgi:hypothetical protein
MTGKGSTAMQKGGETEGLIADDAVETALASIDA